VIDIANLPDRVSAFDVKRVREEITNEETGTTFLLADDGYIWSDGRPSSEIRRAVNGSGLISKDRK